MAGNIHFRLARPMRSNSFLYWPYKPAYSIQSKCQHSVFSAAIFQGVLHDRISSRTFPDKAIPLVCPVKDQLDIRVVIIFKRDKLFNKSILLQLPNPLKGSGAPSADALSIR